MAWHGMIMLLLLAQIPFLLVRTDTKKRATRVPTATFQSERAATIIPHILMMKTTIPMMIDCGTNRMACGGSCVDSCQ
jgi:hypothetical protein